MHLDETLSWPFFDDGHRRFAESLSRWADATLGALPHDDVDAMSAVGGGAPHACRTFGKGLPGE